MQYALFARGFHSPNTEAFLVFHVFSTRASLGFTSENIGVSITFRGYLGLPCVKNGAFYILIKFKMTINYNTKA